MYVSKLEESEPAPAGNEPASMGFNAAWRNEIAADLAERIGVDTDELMRVLENPNSIADYLDFQGISEDEFHYAFVQAFQKTRENWLQRH
jgi:hypothetical protein